MKATYLSFLLALFSMIVSAQFGKIGIIGNPQVSWLSSKHSDVNTQGFILGWGTKLGIDYFFAENYSISGGISLENFGGRASYDKNISYKVNKQQHVIPSGTALKLKLQYLGFPVGLKLRTQEIGYSTGFINIGFTPMFNLKARVFNAGVFPDKSSAKEETRFMNMNYFFCLGVEHSLGGHTSLIGGLTYSAGFMDVTTRSSDKITTKSFGLRTGIIF